MTTLARQMNDAAMAQRLDRLADELWAAAQAGDPVAVGRAEHALRSAVIAVVGAASLMDAGAAARMRVLARALRTVRAAARALSGAAEGGGATHRGNLAYLATDRRRGDT